MSDQLIVTNPADGSVLSTLRLPARDEIQKIVEAAYEVRASWRATPIHQRAAVLNRFADLVEEKYADELAQLSTAECGKPIAQSTEESIDAARITRATVRRALHHYGEVLTENMPGLESDLIYNRREPLGVVACIIPFNFPLELTVHKLAPSLIMGNTVIVKAPSSNPLAVLRLGEILSEAGLPDGVGTFIVCNRVDATEVMITSPKVAAVALTGSTEAGIDVARNAAGTVKNVMLELGGNDALIALDDVDPQKLAQEMIIGRLFNNGQVCAATKRVLVHNRTKDDVVGAMIEMLQSINVGPATDPETYISTLVSETAARKVEEQIALTVRQGATCVYGGQRTGARVLPVLLTDVTRDMDVARDLEIFGPVIPIIGYDDVQEAIDIANASIYGLSSGVMSADLERAFAVGDALEAGATVLNGSGHYRHYDQGFGGYKSSGLGREGVATSIEEYSQMKTFVIKGALRRQL
jgi:acyl-CoA reductase-like NAD-dependent aldehyde dehydrogenase